MPFAFDHLDAITRPLMLEEVDSDIAANKLYLSDRLSGFGRTKYPALLREAALFFQEVWLAEQLRNHDCFNPTFPRKNPKGGISEVRMPINAPEVLAEGEYNRFYMRGLCRRAMNEVLRSWLCTGQSLCRALEQSPKASLGC